MGNFIVTINWYVYFNWISVNFSPTTLINNILITLCDDSSCYNSIFEIRYREKGALFSDETNYKIEKIRDKVVEIYSIKKVY